MINHQIIWKSVHSEAIMVVIWEPATLEPFLKTLPFHGKPWESHIYIYLFIYMSTNFQPYVQAPPFFLSTQST